AHSEIWCQASAWHLRAAMRDDELQRALESVTPPDSAEARSRAWAVIRAAHAEREPSPRRRPFVRPVLALAAVGAIVAAALSPPGRAVLSDVRDAIAPTRVERSAPALFALPSPGGLLVESTNGVWVVHADGSKRLLSGYREASWSPHGLFIVAANRNQLAALEPNGDVRWTLARPNVRDPRWGGTFADTRIAYVTHPAGRVPALRVVAGDDSGDHLVTKGLLALAPAWKPGSIRVIAVARADGRVRLWNADTRAVLAVSPGGERPVALAWSHDGRRLYALGRRHLEVLDNRAQPVRADAMPA